MIHFSRPTHLSRVLFCYIISFSSSICIWFSFYRFFFFCLLLLMQIKAPLFKELFCCIMCFWAITTSKAANCHQQPCSSQLGKRCYNLNLFLMRYCKNLHFCTLQRSLQGRQDGGKMMQPAHFIFSSLSFFLRAPTSFYPPTHTHTHTLSFL